MPEIHPTMTGLEVCFEAELAKLPGWHNEFLEFEHEHTASEPSESKQDQAVKEDMLLGLGV